MRPEAPGRISTAACRHLRWLRRNLLSKLMLAVLWSVRDILVATRDWNFMWTPRADPFARPEWDAASSGTRKSKGRHDWSGHSRGAGNSLSRPRGAWSRRCAEGASSISAAREDWITTNRR